jgi:hypothetical protein
MGLFQKLFGKRQIVDTVNSDLPVEKKESKQAETKKQQDKIASPLVGFDPFVYAHQQEKNRGLNYSNAGMETYRILANALRQIPALTATDTRIPKKTWPFSFEKMIDELDFHIGQSAAQGVVVPVTIRHGIFVYVDTNYEIAKLNDDSYLLWNGQHDPRTTSENTIIVGNLEIKRNDLGLMSWRDAEKACSSIGPGWRLPTIDELKFLYENKEQIGGFKDDYYWSFSDFSPVSAWVQSFAGGNQDSSAYDGSPFNVRAVRVVERIQQKETFIMSDQQMVKKL